MSQEVSGRAGRATSDGDRLSDWIAPRFADETPDMARVTPRRGELADIGWSEHPDYRAEQVFLRILRMPLVGLIIWSGRRWRSRWPLGILRWIRSFGAGGSTPC